MNNLLNGNEKLKTNNNFNETINIKILESMINHLKEENNQKLIEMITDLINYNKKFENLDDFHKEQQLLNIKHTLYQYLHKNYSK